MAEIQKTKENNPMRKIRIEKLILNICIGETGDRLTRASRVLQELSGQTPVENKAHKTIRAFGIRRNDKIATCVTVRGSKALELLEKGLKVKEYQLNKSCFSESGIFGFGIQEHIDLGYKYDPNIGIFGIDFSVHLTRPGYRVCKRRAKKTKVGPLNRVNASEARNWFEQTFDGQLF
uniref:Large ribosomal subunit protein uL5 n=1 Tax=Dermatophagoides pteronyssinus TaxID=6956 RepID=A0A6P6XM24_DERPT|nr:60S ribosomal protein L11-A-like [Dermatophagoides pteronyssinus]